MSARGKDRSKEVAGLLRKAADLIEAGTCVMTEAQAEAIIDELANRPMNREQASVYLGMSASNFSRLVRAGILPAGKKVAGLRELIWFKRDIDRVTF